MTLPKAISDAIEAYAAAIAGACANFDDGTPGIRRAALERAIAEHVAPASARKLLDCQFGDIGSGKHTRYEVFTTPEPGWSVGDPLPNLTVEVGGKVTRYVPEKQGGQ